MSDSEDELNVDLSRWKPRTVNTATQPSAPAPLPRTFASINTPATATDTANHFEEDDFDIDAIVVGDALNDGDDALQPRASTPQPTTSTKSRQTVQVVITQDPTFNRDDYTDCTYGANIVRRVLKEIAKKEDVYYNVEFVDRHTEQVSFNDLLQYGNGQDALQEYTENVQDADHYAEEESDVEQIRRPKPSKSGYVDTVEALEYLDQEDYPSRLRKSRKARKYDSDSEEDGSAPRRSRRVVPTNIDFRRTSRRLKSISQADSEDDDDDGFILQSDVLPSRKRKRSLRSQSNPINYADGDEDELQYNNSRSRTSRPSGQGVRQSGRSTRHQGDMQDPGVNDIYRSESEPRP
ncbi:hypothetical protein KCU75_g7348, partial [Aureobasidium melanogenum]